MKFKNWALVATCAIALPLAACGGSDSASTPDSTESSSNGDGGSVFVTGSSTVEPISIKVGELAGTDDGGNIKVTVEGPGTGDGFKKFCAGDGDITGASRPIKEEEAIQCADAGIEYVELAVAIDGLTVATSVNNTAIECLDKAALYALIGPESEGFSSWADANTLAGELGSAYALPDAPLSIFGPGEESGTYDSFVEFAFKSIAGDRGTEVIARADYTASPNDNVIVDGIESADTSLGWVGYAYYRAETDRMKAIAIANDEGVCVLPTDETIADGSYSFSRTLYIYVNKAKAVENPAIGTFVDLYLSAAGVEQVVAAGYVQLEAAKQQSSVDAWTARG
ncbi:MAG: phosphate-binding protein [Ilumatobacteraceae bacterium]|nr:phosphate-binding protein [Ilumatobacteraceae bacterium]